VLGKEYEVQMMGNGSHMSEKGKETYGDFNDDKE
jgi:hypothetical protein